MGEDHWTFSLQEILNSPTTRTYNRDYELQLYHKLTGIIIDSGAQFKLSPSTVCMGLIYLFRYYQMEVLDEKKAENIAFLSILLASMKAEEKINSNVFFQFFYNIPQTGRTQKMIDFVNGFSSMQKRHMNILEFDFEIPEYDKHLTKFKDVLQTNQLRAIRRMFEALSKTQTIIMFELDELVRLLVGLFCLYNDLDFSSFKNKVLKVAHSGQDEYVDKIFQLIEAIETFFPDHILRILPIEGQDYCIDTNSYILHRDNIYDYFDLVFFIIDVEKDYCTVYSEEGTSMDYDEFRVRKPISEFYQNNQTSITAQHTQEDNIFTSENLKVGELIEESRTFSLPSLDSSSKFPNNVISPIERDKLIPQGTVDYKRRKHEQLQPIVEHTKTTSLIFPESVSKPSVGQDGNRSHQFSQEVDLKQALDSKDISFQASNYDTTLSKVNKDKSPQNRSKTRSLTHEQGTRHRNRSYHHNSRYKSVPVDTNKSRLTTQTSSNKSYSSRLNQEEVTSGNQLIRNIKTESLPQVPLPPQRKIFSQVLIESRVRLNHFNKN